MNGGTLSSNTAVGSGGGLSCVTSGPGFTAFCELNSGTIKDNKCNGSTTCGGGIALFANGGTLQYQNYGVTLSNNKPNNTN